MRRQHYGRVISKRMFHSENASNVFHPHYAIGLKNAAQFESVFEENAGREITWVSQRHRFQKAKFLKYFRPHENVNPAGLKGVFEKFRFRDGLAWRISVTD